MARIINKRFMDQYGDLVNEIANNWDKESPEDMDIILELRDSMRAGVPSFRLYVVWDKFKGIPGPIRSHIILQAFRMSKENAFKSEGQFYDEDRWRDDLQGFDVAIGASSAEEAALLGIADYTSRESA